MRDGLAFYCKPCARQRLNDSKRRRNGPPKTRNGQGPKDIPEDCKWCPECGLVKPITDFPKNRSAKNGLQTYCKPCHNVVVEANRAKRGGTRNYHLKHRYGITLEDFDRMLAEQNGLCAICLEAPAVHVDHDHETGKVRGLLCFNCNGALGQFRDRPDLMSRAALYLTVGPKSVADLAGFGFAFAAVSSENQRHEGETLDGLFDEPDDAEAV